MFWKDFYESCQRYLLPDDEKTYFVFTDALSIEHEKENPNIKRIFQTNLGWPDNTLKRFHIFLKNEQMYDNLDYLYFFNSNLLVLKTITREMFLPEKNNLMVTIHPGFLKCNKEEFTYERNKNSTAFIPKGEGEYYVAGGLNGAKKDVFLKMMKELKHNIDEDEKNNIVACWHDESHLNAYIYKHKEYQTLSPSFLYPEGWRIPFEPYILVRDKMKYGGHEFLRDGNLFDFCRKGYKYLFIYGNGLRGKRLYNKLLNEKISITGFIVSDDQEKKDKDVTYISNLKTPPDKTGIIVSTRLEYQGTIKLHCLKHGYNNVFCIFK